MIEDHSLPETVEIRAFGQRLQLLAPKLAFLRQDSLWRLKTHYGPAMAARSLEPQGLAIDIGAGFGAFALPFALAYPGWTVLAFEPDPLAFAALARNAARLGAANLIALPLAVGPDAALDDPEAVGAALGEALYAEPGAAETLARLLPRQAFARHSTDHGFMQPGLPPDAAFHEALFPTLPVSLLTDLAPHLLKITAPQMETPVFEALRDVPVDHLLGERWSHVDWALVCGEHRPGRREAWLPLTGPGLLVLRHTPGPRRRGLDVVVALYNQAAYVQDCVAALVAQDCEDLRVIVVDDGSTDDSLALLQAAFGHHPRVTLLSKANGGCASARNYGRMQSDASHIAFVDADDLPGPDLFPGLLELARQTGAEIVQGGYHLFEGASTIASVESREAMVIQAQCHRLGAHSCHLLPAWWLISGQPTIWRRVYRRDFLDNRRLWFPEHIRAFNDQIFQLLTLQAVDNVPMLDGVSYGYRQHPGQDIRQKDERHFYSLEMFRMALRRGLTEGWHDFQPLLRSFVNTVNWVTEGLRPDLLPAFLQGTAELWVMAGKVQPQPAPEDVDFSHPDLAALIAEARARLDDLPQSTAYVFLDSLQWQVPMVRAPWS
ncbi:FkbM family methyltransferase [Stagnihabitans tardus]|uniref:FkbM family methyltransferase n=1 Tax=Stagnihabitans tardus TaxID=2699202 RepID=A0AAE4YAZ7_9RHOB|nr:FkbM family methyltransferase [Stagnihabitans tardus]NBZ86620.1 FkbM family methyltransferase [Stagnihabitans tardus]